MAAEIKLRTDQAVVDRIYDMLESTDRILRRHDIPYCIVAGTLLGAIRHGGFIPWDDDADIFVHTSDRQRIVALREEFEDEGWELLEYWSGEHLKVQDPAGKRLPGGGRFPFVELIFAEETWKVIRGEEREVITYAYPESQQGWPDEWLTLPGWDELVDIPFGHLRLLGPAKVESLRYLTDAYGPDWRQTARTHDFDHRANRERHEVESASIAGRPPPAYHSLHPPVVAGPAEPPPSNRSRSDPKRVVKRRGCLWCCWGGSPSDKHPEAAAPPQIATAAAVPNAYYSNKSAPPQVATESETGDSFDDETFTGSVDEDRS
eukprot:TRINITY_DN2286_c0_g1_i1.p2 TRINITY_DN2286_c0_g1~~TRINITY_DN2286_c0_g1_i1.p2  ORF type:complete len:319 (+),score=53.07 TRINITY_DN2286_c0_g1_i1:1451-2407(+)